MAEAEPYADLAVELERAFPPLDTNHWREVMRACPDCLASDAALCPSHLDGLSKRVPGAAIGHALRNHLRR